MEEIPQQFVANPLITWGIIVSTIGAFQDNMQEAPARLGFKKVNIGIDFPYEERTPSAIVIGLDGLEVRNSGMYSAELTDPRNQLLFSYGKITVDLWTSHHNHLMTMADYITQCYLMNLFDGKKMFHPGLDRTYIAIGYGGGVLNWSRFGKESPPHTDESYETLFHTSTSFSFKAEHHLSTDLARISAIDIEAVPMNVIVE
jgi:hypothetical protein